MEGGKKLVMSAPAKCNPSHVTADDLKIIWMSILERVQDLSDRHVPLPGNESRKV